MGKPTRSAAVLLLALAACSKRDGGSAPVPSGSSASVASSAVTAAVPLVWDAPATWTKLDLPPVGAEKVAYRIGAAELYVFFYGAGPQGEPARVFNAWLGQFEGDTRAAQDKLHAGALEVDTVEAHGTYRITVPRPRRGKRSEPSPPVVKNDYRVYGAVVRTPDRGNWFFKLAGPDEAVQAAKPAVQQMLESVR